MKNCITGILIISALFLVSCNTRSNLYDITDDFVISLQTEYDSYGMAGYQEKRFTEDGKYQVFPLGRLVNVKIMEEADDKAYQQLLDDLKDHYEGNYYVNNVYRCNAGTIMIDCRN